MVSLLDIAIGKMKKALKRFGLLDDTIIFFPSDVILNNNLVLLLI
jgi:arylsulfatase A-like enzyme